jgi:hypothetical protein
MVASLKKILSLAQANTALVSKSGDDTKGSIGGGPFLTINGAISAIQSASLTGITILVFPGTYDETITLPAGNSLRGVSLSTVIIRSQNVVANTTLVTMGESTRLEDVTMQLTSTVHVNLIGIAFPGTTTQTSKIRNAVLTVDNSSASSTGTSNVYGIYSNGTGTPDTSVSTARACTITVRSSGLGTKRGVLVDTNINNFNVRDVNFLVSNVGGGSGSYIAAEVNKSGAQISLRLVALQGPTADISQTAGTIFLGSANLLGSGTNNLAFTAVQQPSQLLWADPGNLPQNATRFYRPGTASVTTTEILLRLSQRAVVKALSVRSLTGPGGTVTDTWTIRKNGVDTVLTVSLTGSQTSNINSTNAITFQAGDTISLKVVTGSGTATTDSVIQVDVF